jgi:hypothetical protein
MRITTSTAVIISLALATTVFSVLSFAKKGGTPTEKASIATITEMENASVKADTAGDSSYVEKNYANTFSGGSSWGNWETKQSILADMKDSNNNKTYNEEISDLKKHQRRQGVQKHFLHVLWGNYGSNIVLVAEIQSFHKFLPNRCSLRLSPFNLFFTLRSDSGSTVSAVQNWQLFDKSGHVLGIIAHNFRLPSERNGRFFPLRWSEKLLNRYSSSTTTEYGNGFRQGTNFSCY